MKICFLTLKTFSATGGIEKFNRCFSKALVENAAARGWEATVYSAYDEATQDAYVPAKHFRPFAQKRAAFLFAAIGAMSRSDVVIFSHINLAPLVLICRGLFPRKRTILIAHGREVWEALSAPRARALQAVHEVWSVSRYTAGILQTQKGVKGEHTRIFPNCIDPFFTGATAIIGRQALKERYGIGPGSKVLLTIARLADTEPLKGYDAVIRVLPGLITEFPGLRYVLAGKWDETEKSRIDALVKDLELQRTVLLPGFIAEAELISHYEMADAFILPSRKEGFGIVFLEAAWTGLPVIAGNSDGSPEALLQGELGILVDPLDETAIASAIRNALDSPLTESERKMRKETILEHFGFDKFRERQRLMLESK